MDSIFEQVKKEAEFFYKTIGSIECPYFGERVNFNTNGLDHVKFKGWNKTRTVKDQYMRLKLIRFAPEIICRSHTLQGYHESKEFVRKKTNGRWENILTPVFYYEFVAILEKKRLRVIIRQIEGGQKHFWSIIPFWKKDLAGKRIMHYGKPSED